MQIIPESGLKTASNFEVVLFFSCEKVILSQEWNKYNKP